MDWFKSWSASDKVSRAKKNQIDHVLELIESNNKIFDLALKNQTETEERLFKREACIFYHGISMGEFNRFVNSSMAHVEQIIGEAESEGYYEIPVRFLPAYGQDHLKLSKEIRQALNIKEKVLA